MNALQQRAVRAVDAAGERLIALADQLHDEPEVGYHEIKSSQRVADFLRAEGFAVEKPYAGMETAILATRGQGKPKIAILAEYDALPEIGHGCGHNLIATGALGGAVGAAAVVAETGGTLVLLGTPAEELLYEGPGKVRLLDAGAFDDVDAVIMFHPWTRSALLIGDRAVIAVDVAFHGRPAHAAADPWNGANALDGVMLMFNAINALRQQLKPEVRIHGKVTHGGDVPNIIHAYASAQVLVRAEDTDYLYNDVLPKVENCARGAALATGTRVELQRSVPIDSTLPNPVLQDLIGRAAVDVGVEFGEPVFMGGSTDFGNVSQRVPATYFVMAIGVPADAAWHSKEVAAAAGSPAGHAGMLAAARILAAASVELLQNPELVSRAWAAHPRR